MTDDERSDAEQVLAELDPQPAHEVIPVSRRQTLRALASVGALSAVGSAHAQSAGTVVADEAYFSNYGWESSAEGGTLTIDGDQYTFDGSEEIGLPDGGVGTEVLTPDGSASELIGPSGQTLWETPIPDSVIDTFEEILYEDGGKTLSDYYTGDLNAFERSTDSPVQQGSYSLKCTSTSESGLYSTTGLNRYPSRGDSFSAWVQPGGSDYAGVLFGGSDADNTYILRLVGAYNNFQLSRLDNGSSNLLDTTTAAISSGEWYQCEISFGDPTISASLTDSNGNTLDSVSADDTTYTTTGFGWLSKDGGTDTFDFAEIVN